MWQAEDNLHSLPEKLFNNCLCTLMTNVGSYTKKISPACYLYSLFSENVCLLYFSGRQDFANEPFNWFRYITIRKDKSFLCKQMWVCFDPTLTFSRSQQFCKWPIRYISGKSPSSTYFLQNCFCFLIDLFQLLFQRDLPLKLDLFVYIQEVTLYHNRIWFPLYHSFMGHFFTKTLKHCLRIS